MIDDAQLISKLLAAGLVDQGLLQQGIELAEKSASTLYHALILNDLVEEREVVQIASDLLNVPSVDLAQARIDEDVVRILPADIARRSQSLPLELIDDGGNEVLRLAMTDPIDVMAMDEVASHIGVNIRPVLVGPSDLNKALARVYREREVGGGASEILEAGASADEDSWAALFEQPEEVELIEESSVISQEMRDRPPTDMFEVVDEELFQVDRYERKPLDNLVDSGPGTPVKSRVDLDDWDLDDAFYDSEAPLKPAVNRLANANGGPEKNRNDRTFIGVGMRGELAELGLGFHESEEEAGEQEEEEILHLEEISAEVELEEISAPSLEHSIELALELGEEDLIVEPDSQATRAVPLISEDRLGPEDRADQIELPAEEEPPLREPAQRDQEKSAVVPNSIRAALKRVADRNKASGDDDKGSGDPTLGRIKVKQIAVPKFKGVVEKRSDQTREEELLRSKADEPTTREISVTDLVGLTAGTRETYEALPVLREGLDEGALLRGLIGLLVDKNLLSTEELQALIDDASDEG